MEGRSGEWGRKETFSAQEVEDTGMSDVQNSRAVLAALKGLQDKIRSLEVGKVILATPVSSCVLYYYYYILLY